MAKFIPEIGKEYLYIKPRTKGGTTGAWRVEILEINNEKQIVKIAYKDSPWRGRTCLVSTDSIVSENVAKKYFFQG